MSAARRTRNWENLDGSGAFIAMIELRRSADGRYRRSPLRVTMGWNSAVASAASELQAWASGKQMTSETRGAGRA